MGDISIKGRSPILFKNSEIKEIKLSDSDLDKKPNKPKPQGPHMWVHAEGGRVGLKKGGFPIKTKKVKPGFDQEFTLPKGTSAAPIKQSKVKKIISKLKQPVVDGVLIGGAGAAGWELGKKASKKKIAAAKKSKK